MSVAVVCPQCLEHGRGRHEMKFEQEFATGHRFACRICGTVRFCTKDKVGGTVGSGQRGDGRQTALGTGYGAGTRTFRKYHSVK